MKKDAFMTGFVPGLILPWIGFYLYYLMFFSYMSFAGFFKHVEKANLMISVLSLGVILNLVLFFYFYKVETDKSARGVIGASFVYAFIVVYVKMIA
jgi:hypothetical protein